MRRLVSAYIVLLLLFLPLLADGSAGALANLWVQAAVLLFSCLGAAIALWRKGVTSGSRIRFKNQESGMWVDLHRPHPGNMMKEWMMKVLYKHLKENGLI